MEKSLILFVDRSGTLKMQSYFGPKVLKGVAIRNPEDNKIPPKGLFERDLEFIWVTMI